eukprot:159579_1
MDYGGNLVSPGRYFEQISELIENSRSLLDLNVIIEQLIPLRELKKLLLDKLCKLKETHANEPPETTHQETDDSPSLHTIYFNSYPFDGIFHDDIICSVVQYLSGSDMFGKLARINKNFNKIMRENPILYQQYKIQVTLLDDTWLNTTNKLYINISHQLQRIAISSTMQPPFPYNTAIPLNSNIAPEQSALAGNTSREVQPLIITSVEDMTRQCPFMWYAIRKWHIITHLADYDQGCLVSTPPYSATHRPSLSQTELVVSSPCVPSPVLTSVHSPNTTDEHAQNTNSKSNMGLMEQLLSKAAPFIRSLQIDERVMAASSTGGVFGMYGLYTLRTDSNLYLNYNYELSNNKKHIVCNVLNQLLSLKDLSHIEWMTDESTPMLKPMSFHTCKNIIYLDLCGSQGYTLLNGPVLVNMHRLAVLSIEFDDLRYMSAPNTQSMENTQQVAPKEEFEQIVVQFPVNIEFIQLKNYDYAGEVVFDLSLCVHIIALQLTISTESYRLSNLLHTIKWPMEAVVECLLVEYSHKMMSPSHHTWNEHIQMLIHNNKLPVKCIRCITNSYSLPMWFQMGTPHGYDDSKAETVDHVTYTNLVGIGESREDNSDLVEMPKHNETDEYCYGKDGDGVLWKTLICNKYLAGNVNVDEKIQMYKKYFDMDLMKWIYHLGRDYRALTTNMCTFESASFPDTAVGDNDKPTISSNLVINPQYVNENELQSSSSAIFAVD